jgi:5-methylcytosine-specific restriction endonuclease McrA
MDTLKYCANCKIYKQISNFNSNKSKKDKLHTQCKICCIAYAKKYYAKNKQKLLEEQKLRAMNRKEEISNVAKQRYSAKKSEILEANSKYYSENKTQIYQIKKQWVDINKDKIISYKAQRRAKKLNATPTWLNKEQRKLIQNFYKEARQLKLLTGIAYEVDHIIPLQGKLVCGLHVPWNLQILKESENCSKGNKLLEDNINGD